MEAVQPGEVEVAPIEDIDGAGLHDQGIQEVDVVHGRRGDEEHAGDAPPQIQEGVELHCPFALAERGPGEERQAEVDDGRIQGIDRLLQLDPEILGGVQGARGRDQPLGEVGVDLPIAHLVGMGERVAGDPGAESHVVELGLGDPEAGLNIPQALPEGQLGKRHAEELVPAGEALDLVVAVVAVDALAELVRGDEVHQLGEDRPADVHGPAPLGKMRESGPRRVVRSNR